MTIGLLLGFLPWLLFALLPAKNPHELSVSIIIILLVSIVCVYRDLRKGFILAWGTLIFFCFAAVTISIFQIIWVMKNMGTMVYAMLLLIAWGSLLIGKPFTIQYAREQVDPSKWHNPLFIRANKILTIVWGSIFFFNMCIAIAQNYYPIENFIKILLTNGLTLLGMWFNVWFPKWFRNKYVI